MNKETFKKEEKHLEKTLNILGESKGELQKSLKSLGEETINKLEKLRENTETNAMDFFLYLEQIHQKHAAFNLKDRYKRLEEMQYSLDEPYFARIDLKKKTGSNPKKIYIGKFGFSENHRPIITDWRSKIASVYYRYRFPQKDVKYDTPEGEKVRDLVLKRTFDINEGSLNKYYNNDIQLDESEIIVDKIEERTGGVLEDIVETIQEAQLDIIEEDPRTPMVVQGCVGSGKSTVAIHRLSHIFFNHPKLIQPQRSILIANKQILVSYLATLFPKLGIFDINYRTLSDLIYNFTFREELGVKVDFSLPLDKEKLNIESLEKVRKLVVKLDKEYEAKLEDVFEDELESYGGYVYDPEITAYENLQYITSELNEEFLTQKRLLKENPNSPRLWLYKLNVNSLRKILTKLNKLKRELKKKSLKDIVNTMNIDLNSKLDYGSTLLLVYIYSKTIGFTKTQKYQYCIVDEGQDFSPLEFAVLNEFILHKRFCILGDLNQGYSQAGIKNWNNLEKIFEISDLKKFKLETNYRSTKPIIDLANKILSPFTEKYLPKSIKRKGAEPKLLSFESADDLYVSVEKDLKEDLKIIKKSIGIICYDDNSFNRMQEILDNLPIEQDRKKVLSSDKRINYSPRSIYLTKFENCKGLEFAKVYVVGRNPLENASIKEAKKSFVGVTRAMDQLNAYYLKNNE